MFKRSIRTAFAVLLLSSMTTTFAQNPDGPYWSTISIPANFTSVQALGSIVYMRTTTAAYFFSGITRTWTTVPVSGPTAAVTLCNKYALVRDGTLFTAFSARTGQAQSISVGPSAVLIAGSPSSSWVCAVRDGLDLWGFGAFNGTWDQITLQSSNVTTAATSYAVVVEDGVNAYAIGAYGGTFVATPAVGATLAAGGMTAVADDGVKIQCFSAHRNTWVSQLFTQIGASNIRDGFATFSDGATVLAYSALTHTFDTVTPIVPGPAVILSNRNAAAVADGQDTHCYAAGTGRFTTVTLPAVPVINVQPEYVLLDDGTGITAFSALDGDVAPKLPGTPLQTYSNDDVCMVETGTLSAAYSAISGAWAIAPAVTPLQVITVRNAVIIVGSASYEAFAARTGTWSSLPVTQANNYSVQTSGAVFAAIDGQDISVFDSRYARWVTTTATFALQTVNIWRQVLVANDGVNLYGYSLMNNVWETTTIPDPVIQQAANSSIGFVRTATTLNIYDAHGSLSTLSRYPEFTRMQPKGTDFTMIQVAPPGSIVTTGVSLGTTYGNLGFFGNLFIDPAQVVILTPLGVVPPNGILDLTFPTPNDPAFNNLQLFLQNVIQTPTGQVYFTNAIAPHFI